MSICLNEAGPGFTLPANIGDLDPAIFYLNLSACNLIGNAEQVGNNQCLVIR